MAGFPNLIKVGRTSQTLARRLSDLNTGNPYKLTVMRAWKVKNPKEGENAAHSYLNGDPDYKKARPTHGGGSEWFIIQNGNLAKVCKGIKKALETKGQFVEKVIK